MLIKWYLCLYLSCFIIKILEWSKRWIAHETMQRLVMQVRPWVYKKKSTKIDWFFGLLVCLGPLCIIYNPHGPTPKWGELTFIRIIWISLKLCLWLMIFSLIRLCEFSINKKSFICSQSLLQFIYLEFSFCYYITYLYLLWNF